MEKMKKEEKKKKNENQPTRKKSRKKVGSILILILFVRGLKTAAPGRRGWRMQPLILQPFSNQLGGIMQLRFPLLQTIYKPIKPIQPIKPIKPIKPIHT